MKFLWILICLCFAATASAGNIDPQEIDRRIQKLMQDPNMVGLSVAIIDKGEMVFAKGYGETIKGSGKPVSEDTVFRWASVSKGVAAAAVLQLSEEGHFGLASPVKAHAPSLELPESKHAATVQDVLSHRTGLARNSFDRKIESGQSAKALRYSLKNLSPICEPGACHRYQNVAFDAAAEMVETATGLPYKSVIAQRFFKPLGMKTATITRQGLLRSKNWARPHNRQGRMINSVKPTYYRLPGAAGVNSSVKDLGRWMQAQMTTSDIPISGDIRSTLQTPLTATPIENNRIRRHYSAMNNARYGLGWRIYDYNGHKVIGHRGSVQGYRALLLFDPAKESGIAVMWNSPHGRPVGLQLEFMDQLYGLPRRDWMRIG